MKREELIEIMERFHLEIESDNYLKYLNELEEKINSKEYVSDNRFVTYGRREFLREEFTYNLNNGSIKEAFYDLDDYIKNITWIPGHRVLDKPNPNQIIKDNDDYKKDGMICLEEKEILIDMIDEMINYLMK